MIPVAHGEIHGGGAGSRDELREDAAVFLHGMENFVIFPWVADVYPAAQDCVGGLSTLDGASVGIAVTPAAMPLMMLTPALASSPA